MLLVVTALTGACRATGPDLAGAWDMTMDPDFSGKHSVEHCHIQRKSQVLAFACGDAGAPMTLVLTGRHVVWGFRSLKGYHVEWVGELDGAASTIRGGWHFTYDDGDASTGHFAAQRTNP